MPTGKDNNAVGGNENEELNQRSEQSVAEENKALQDELYKPLRDDESEGEGGEGGEDDAGSNDAQLADEEEKFSVLGDDVPLNGIDENEGNDEEDDGEDNGEEKEAEEKLPHDSEPEPMRNEYSLFDEKAEEEKKEEKEKEEKKAEEAKERNEFSLFDDDEEQEKKDEEAKKKKPKLVSIEIIIGDGKYTLSPFVMEGKTPEEKTNEINAFYESIRGDAKDDPNAKAEQDAFVADTLAMKPGENGAPQARVSKIGDEYVLAIVGDVYLYDKDGNVTGYNEDLIHKLAEQSLTEFREKEAEAAIEDPEAIKTENEAVDGEHEHLASRMTNDAYLEALESDPQLFEKAGIEVVVTDAQFDLETQNEKIELSVDAQVALGWREPGKTIPGKTPGDPPQPIPGNVKVGDFREQEVTPDRLMKVLSSEIVPGEINSSEEWITKQEDRALRYVGHFLGNGDPTKAYKCFLDQDLLKKGIMRYDYAKAEAFRDAVTPERIREMRDSLWKDGPASDSFIKELSAQMGVKAEDLSQNASVTEVMQKAADPDKVPDAESLQTMANSVRDMKAQRASRPFWYALRHPIDNRRERNMIRDAETLLTARYGVSPERLDPDKSEEDLRLVQDKISENPEPVPIPEEPRPEDLMMRQNDPIQIAFQDKLRDDIVREEEGIENEKEEEYDFVLVGDKEIEEAQKREREAKKIEEEKIDEPEKKPDAPEEENEFELIIN